MGNGFEVLQALDRFDYDIVLMDCHMPEMDGYEATAAIRQREGAGKHTWIIAMTANAMSGDREQCLVAGMDDYVSKPVRLSELAEVLERAHGEVAAQATAPAVDPQSLATLRELPGENGENLLQELVQIFFQSGPQALEEIQAALTRSDAPAVAFTAHTLKSSCGQFGAARLQEYCAALEKAGRAGHLEPMTELLSSAQNELRRVLAALEPGRQLPNHMKILIAEDDAIAAKVLRLTLQALHHEVVLASDGTTAWEMFDQDPVRVVVSDWMMPGMDGLQFCERIRNRAQTPYTYFILLTAAQTCDDDYTLAMDSGVDDFLTKPLHRETLRTRLRVAERILRYTTEIRQLKDIIPICTYCHKVRDDGDYWERVETYIRERTGSRFSHGVCPECFDDQVKVIANLCADLPESVSLPAEI